MRAKLLAASATTLMGAGVVLGVLLGGSSAPAKQPVVVQHVDAVITSSEPTSARVAAPVVAPVDAAPTTVSSSAVVAAAPVQKAAPVTEPVKTPAKEDAPIQGVAIASLSPGAPVPPLLPGPKPTPDWAPLSTATN